MGKLELRVLSDAEVEKLHHKTLEIFETVGIKVGHEEALKKLSEAGASVDYNTSIARLPARMINELLKSAPSVVNQTGVNGKMLNVGGDNRYYMSLVIDPFIADYHDGLRRPVLEDVRRHTIIGESLDCVHSLTRMQFPVTDVPEPDSYYKTMEIFLCHHTKHTSALPTSVENCREWMDVMEVISDAAGLDPFSTPLLTLAMAITSPLQVHAANVEIMKMALERCYPIVPTTCPMAGTTAPYSIASTALIANVEALMPVIMTQLYKPGHPVIYAVGPSVTDMKTGHDLYYGAEKANFKIIGNQMAGYYGLPNAGEAGGSLTHRPDLQNGAESMMYLLSSISTGQNLINGLGSLHNANGMSAEQIIMQAGLAQMAEFIARGVDTSEYKLAVNSIRKAGPGGNFLDDSLTLELLRSNEFSSNPYLDLTGGYVKDAPGVYEIAHEKAEQLVADYKPTVPQKVQNAVRNFFKDKYRSTKIADIGWD